MDFACEVLLKDGTWAQENLHAICGHRLRASCEPKRSICGHLRADQSSCVHIRPSEPSICGHLQASAHLAEISYFLRFLQ
ncbi:uncharacterized protein LACBIDRAFT_297997 [Laccaria bicolor S238N-H82]|uniref:Predicted protein n=1 Tax=Laccaria bicolor (strain S238N-H82 / ATCC MYA-4686) TaxID=486041 RepID=B0DC08_LACBS|nr:uncharacterized protein LACBIDRAFT_297997 [Laccaria bicolor S238N-H82]EDR07650.1 predicted protein [Laccaria bicolor S238N-H82]|eukprot:XP_001881439.1 predicted protein [Laccaria bicolor S238N-H82]